MTKSANENLWKQFFPALAGPGEAGLSRLRERARYVTFPSATRVFGITDSCEHYLLLIKGRVRVELLAANGREVVLYHVEPGQSCILTTSCLIAGTPYPALGVTETEVSAFVIAQPAFEEALNESPVFRRFVFNAFGTRLADIIARLEAVALMPVDRRLARALCEASQAIGTVRLTHQALAAEIGTAREVVSRHLKEFERRGWIRMERGAVRILDVAAMHAIADESV